MWYDFLLHYHDMIARSWIRSGRKFRFLQSIRTFMPFTVTYCPSGRVIRVLHKI